MAQPQPCAHEFDERYYCRRCGHAGELVVDIPEAFGACWRAVDTLQLRDQRGGPLYFKAAGVVVYLNA